jgi:parallel beta-helix repeat protein
LLVAMSAVLLVTPAFSGTTTPIYMPTVITTSGTYQVVKNISSSTGNVIDVVGTGLEDITIDLNGFTLTTGAGFDGIHAVNVRTLTVQNGTISDPGAPGGTGVYAMNVASVQINTLTTLGLGTGVLLQAVVSFDVGGCKILGSSTYGIEVDGNGASATVQGKVHDNVVRNAVMGGVNVHDNHTNVEVLNNSVGQSTGGIGVHLLGGTSCVVQDNKVRGNQTGIQLDAIQWCNVTANTVSENSADGIVLAGADNVYVDHNISVKNVASGLIIGGDQNIILENRLNSNDGHGLFFEAPANNNFYQGNTARYNTGATPGGACPAPACPGLTSPDFCDDGTSNTTGGSNWMPGPPVC